MSSFFKTLASPLGAAAGIFGGGGHKKDSGLTSTAPGYAGPVDPATGMPAANPLQRRGAATNMFTGSQQL